MVPPNKTISMLSTITPYIHQAPYDNTPFVLGISSRPVKLIASRRAIARALNALSALQSTTPLWGFSTGDDHYLHADSGVVVLQMDPVRVYKTL